MQPHDLDQVYTRFCEAMSAVGEDGARLFLTRFALLAMVELKDPDIVVRLIDAAGEGLAPAAPGG